MNGVANGLRVRINPTRQCPRPGRIMGEKNSSWRALSQFPDKRFSVTSLFEHAFQSRPWK
jgi:hypothetical protein